MTYREVSQKFFLLLFDLLITPPPPPLPQHAGHVLADALHSVDWQGIGLDTELEFELC